jgi:hypothetical protein
MKPVSEMSRLELAAFIARECLEQAVLVASTNDVDIEEIERWSAVEGKQEAFEGIKHRLRRGVQPDKPSVRARPRR